MRTSGHDIHFLSRLTERSDDATTERALRLYRDPKLVRAILLGAPPLLPESSGHNGAATVSLGARLRLAGIAPAPDPEERVGIALAAGELPPTVIVARNGHFITCLGAGMRASPMPMVQWERAEQYFILDDASDALESIKRESRLQWLLKTLFHGGFRVTREDFLALRSISPLLFSTWTRQLVDRYDDYMSAVTSASNVSRLRDDNPLSVQLWRSYHALAHYMLLSSLGGPDALNYVFRGAPEEAAYYKVMFAPIIGVAERPLAARALWYIGQLSQNGARAKQLLLRARSSMKTDVWLLWRAAALTLLMIGAQQRKLAPEVKRCLLECRPPEENENEARREQAKRIRDMANWAMRREDELSEAEVNGFRSWAADWCRDGNNPRHAVFLDERGLTTLDFARRLHLNMYDETFTLDDLTDLIRVFPFLASMRAEDFFHPASDANLIEQGYDFDLVARVSRLCRVQQEPVRAEKKPGRNERCHCGSGKKHKKCCGHGDGSGSR